MNVVSKHIALWSVILLVGFLVESCINPPVEVVNVLPAIPAQMAAYYPERFVIKGFGLFGKPQMLANTDTTITLSSGEEHRVQLGVLKLVTWDGGLNYDNTREFTGKGLCLSVDMPVYWIIEGDLKGTWISAGQFFVGGDEECAYHGKAGRYDHNEVGRFFTSYLKANTSDQVDWKAFERGCTGALVQYVDADKDEWSADFGRYYAHVTKMDLQEDEEDEIRYVLDLEWHSFVEKDWYMGIRANKNEKGQVTAIVEPYEYNGHKVELTNGPFDKAAPSPSRLLSPASDASFRLGDMAVWHNDLPQMLSR